MREEIVEAFIYKYCYYEDFSKNTWAVAINYEITVLYQIIMDFPRSET